MNGKGIVAVVIGLSLVLVLNVGIVDAQCITCEAGTDYAAAGDALAAVGDHSAAVDAYYLALAENPLDADLLLHRAESAILSERYLDSFAPYGTLTFFPDVLPSRVAELRAQVAAEPDNLEAWMLLASIDVYTEDGAEDDTAALLEAAPDSAYANLLNAHWLALNGEFEAARPFYEHALELAPDNAHILGWIAREYDLYGETDAALEIIEQAIALEPDVAQLHSIHSSVLLFGVGDADRSAVAIQRAMALDPNDFNIVAAYAYSIGNMEVSVADAEVLLDHFATLLPPGMRLVYMIRANAFLSMGDAGKGAEEVARFVADHPDMRVEGGMVTAGQSVSADMTFGRVIEFQFEAGVGDEIDLRAEDIDGTVDTQIAVLAPDGTGLAFNDDADPSNGDFNGEVIFTAPVEGVYTLFVTHAGGGSEGDIEVTVSVE